MSSVLPCLVPPSEVVAPDRLGDPLLDDYLEFLAVRCRPNSVLAAKFDLKVFFEVVAKPVDQVQAADVLGFITAQRTGAGRLPEPAVRAVPTDTVGVCSRTIRRRLSTVGGLYAFLAVRGDVPANPVPRGLPTRRERGRPGQGVPLVRAPRRTLPRILTPAEVDALTGALRTHRDRAMVAAMVLGGLRRCEVLGLRLGMSTRPSGGCSSLTARAVRNAWCRSRRGSSSTWPPTWRWSALPTPTPTRCSWS